MKNKLTAEPKDSKSLEESFQERRAFLLREAKKKADAKDYGDFSEGNYLCENYEDSLTFYKVISVSEFTATLREVEKELRRDVDKNLVEFMSYGTVRPSGKEIGEEIKVRLMAKKSFYEDESIFFLGKGRKTLLYSAKKEEWVYDPNQIK